MHLAASLLNHSRLTVHWPQVLCAGADTGSSGSHEAQAAASASVSERLAGVHQAFSSRNGRTGSASAGTLVDVACGALRLAVAQVRLGPRMLQRTLGTGQTPADTEHCPGLGCESSKKRL